MKKTNFQFTALHCVPAQTVLLRRPKSPFWGCWLFRESHKQRLEDREPLPPRPHMTARSQLAPPAAQLPQSPQCVCHGSKYFCWWDIHDWVNHSSYNSPLHTLWSKSRENQGKCNLENQITVIQHTPPGNRRQCGFDWTSTMRAALKDREFQRKDGRKYLIW